MKTKLNLKTMINIGYMLEDYLEGTEMMHLPAENEETEELIYT